MHLRRMSWTCGKVVVLFFKTYDDEKWPQRGILIIPNPGMSTMSPQTQKKCMDGPSEGFYERRLGMHAISWVDPAFKSLDLRGHPLITTPQVELD